MLVDVALLDRHVKALVDTGAAVNVLHKSFVANAPHLLLPAAKTRLLAFNGTPVEQVGRVVVNLTALGNTISTEFVVADSPIWPVVLGCGWCQQAGVVLNFTRTKPRASRTLCGPGWLSRVSSLGVALWQSLVSATKRASASLRDLATKWPCRVKPFDVTTVTVASAVTLPPGAATWVYAKLDSPVTADVLFEPIRCSAPARQMTSPRSLLPVLKGEAHVFILNISSVPLALTPGTQLGTASVLDPGSPVASLQPEAPPRHPPAPAILSWEEFNFGPSLTCAELASLKTLLLEHRSCLALSAGELGCTSWAQHRINTENRGPVHHQPRRVAPAERRVIQQHVCDMLDQGIIAPSCSPWSSPVVLVRKKDGTLRFCVDYRKLNAITNCDVYPLPRLDDALDRLKGARYFSTLDLLSGYWQVPVHPDDAEKTAFVTPDGLYQFNRMPFGLSNAPATFQRLMDRVLGHLKWTMALVYLDDVIVYAATFEEHQRRLKLVLEALTSAGLRLKPKKCFFGFAEVTYLGHVVSRHGIRPDPEKLKALTAYEAPTTAKELKSFLGFASYFRRFIPDFAKRSAPLTALLKKNAPWSWTQAQQLAFLDVKHALLEPPTLAHYDESAPIVLHTDASQDGLGAVLLQEDESGDHKVLAYASRQLSDVERRRHSSELECLAVVWAVEKFRPYLYGRHFTIVTDNSALTWLQSAKHLNAKIARWSLQLQEYNFTIVHRRGSAHQDADFLSRHPCSVTALTDLRTAQTQDPAIAAIIHSLGTAAGAGLRQLRRVYRMKDDLLCHVKRLRGRPPVWLPVVPATLRSQILRGLHDAPTAGHLGRGKTYARVSERFWWPNMSRDVKEHVASCQTCQYRKPSTGVTKPPPQAFSPPSSPFELVGLDHLGPFPKTRAGNRYVLVAIDYFSKWVEALPVPDTSSAHAVAFVEQHLVLRHGVPRRLITDRGSCFMSHEFERALRSFGIAHSTTSVNHPQCNGLVERVNRTLTDILASYVAPSHTNWDRFVSAAAFAVNTAAQETTHVTPFSVVYGRTPSIPLDAQLGLPHPTASPTESAQRLHSARLDAQRNLLTAHARVQAANAAAPPHPPFRPGDLVLVRRTIRATGRAAKLLPRYRGPYRVVARLGPVTYRLEDLPEHRPCGVHHIFPEHVSNMKRYVYGACGDSDLATGSSSVPSSPAGSMPSPRNAVP